jgi:hypothetical protein
MSPVRKTRLGDAKALERWPLDGVQQEPEAWLLRVARNRIMTPPVANKVGKIPRGFSSKSPRKRRPSRQRTNTYLTSGKLSSLPLSWRRRSALKPRRVASSFLVSSAAMGQWLVRDKKQNPPALWASRLRTAMGISIPKIQNLLRLDKPTSWYYSPFK